MVFQVLVQTTITLVPIGLVSGSVQKILCGCLIIVRWAAKCVLEYRVSQAFLKVVVVVTRLPWPNKWVPVLYNAIKGPKVNVTSSKKVTSYDNNNHNNNDDDDGNGSNNDKDGKNNDNRNSNDNSCRWPYGCLRQKGKLHPQGTRLQGADWWIILRKYSQSIFIEMISTWKWKKVVHIRTKCSVNVTWWGRGKEFSAKNVIRFKSDFRLKCSFRDERCMSKKGLPTTFLWIDFTS